MLHAAAPQRERGVRGAGNRTHPPHFHDQPDSAIHPQPGAFSPRRAVRRVPALAQKARAPAPLQVRSRFRPAFPRRKHQSPRMRFPALLLDPGRGPKASGDPAPPSQRGANRTAVGGILEKAIRPRASRSVYRLVGDAGAGARFPLGGAEREPLRLRRRLQVSARARRGSRPARVRARGLAGEVAESEIAAPVASAPPPPPPPPSRPPPRPGGRESRPRPPRSQSDPRSRRVKSQRSGALRGTPSPGRAPLQVPVRRRPGRSRVPTPPAAHSLPALPRGGPAAGGRCGARPQHEPQPPARGGQRLPGHHGGEEQGARGRGWAERPADGGRAWGRPGGWPGRPRGLPGCLQRGGVRRWDLEAGGGG